MWKYFLVLMVSYYAYNIYATYLLKSAVLYVRSDPVQESCIQHVKMFSYTDSVYKILSNIDNHLREGDVENRNSWSHIILAIGFNGNTSLENYVKAVSTLNCVEEIRVIIVEPWKFPAHHAFNIFMKIWKFVGKFVNYFPSRPLKSSEKPAFRCDNHHSDTGPVIVFNLLSINSNEIFAKYAIFMFTEIFPLIDSEIYYTGNPYGDYWNELSVVSYESRKVACELGESQIFADHVHLKRASVSDSFTHLCKRIV